MVGSGEYMMGRFSYVEIDSAVEDAIITQYGSWVCDYGCLDWLYEHVEKLL